MKGWTGINCNEDVDECKLMKFKSIIPCSGNGRCSNTKGKFKLHFKITQINLLFILIN